MYLQHVSDNDGYSDISARKNKKDTLKHWMTSFDRNLFDKESKSYRSNWASERVLRYDSESDVCQRYPCRQRCKDGLLTVLNDMLSDLCHGFALQQCCCSGAGHASGYPIR